MMMHPQRPMLFAVGALLLVLALPAAGAGPRGSCGGPCNPGDYDGDRVMDWADNCPLNGNRTQRDSDGDTPPALIDVGTPPSPVGEQTGPVRIQPGTPLQTGQPLPTDFDPTRGGDACDLDDDNDGVYDRRRPGKPGPDNCRLAPNPDQSDSDGDQIGDACDDSNDAAPAPPPLRVQVSAARRARYRDIGAGLPVTVRCTAGCRVVGELVLDRRSARRLRIAGSARSLAVGRGTAALGARGTTYLFVRIPTKNMVRLRRSFPRLRPVLRILVIGDGRPVWSRRVTLMR